MNFDDLAAAVLGVEPNDEEELQQIQETIMNFKDSGRFSAEALRKLNESLECLERMKSEEGNSTDQAVGELNKKIASLQAIIEEESDDGSDEYIQCLDTMCENPPSDDIGVDPSPENRDGTEAGEERKSCEEQPSGTTNEADQSAVIENDPELLAEFISETHEHIQISETALLELETSPDDSERINAVFRAFHTIKGTAGFLGLTHMQRLAHRAENVLDRVRQGEIGITGSYADLVLDSVDMLKGMVQDIENNIGSDELPVPEGLEDIVKRLESSGKTGAFTGIRSEASQRFKDFSDEKAGDPEKETLVSGISVYEGKAGSDSMSSGKAALPESKVNQKKNPKKKVVDETARVSTRRLDDLINMVGELVIANAMISQNPVMLYERNRRLQKDVSQISKITRELQDLSISMRMVPLKGIFQKMLRLVRDLGRKSDKDVQLIIEGEDTEIDRTMVESLNDPLVHMIRNAMDHGIESRNDRRASGKSETGKLKLRAYHAAGNVVIELEDDGKGLDREKILAKAKKNGLVDPDKDPTDSEVFMLIFSAGLSTAEKITDISGRGVGMDVVKKNIETMRGRIEVASVKGEGTKFTIRIPLTLAIIDSMLVRVGKENYLVPTLNVRHAFRPEAEAVSTVQGRGEMVSVRGSLLPLFRLHDIFNVAGAKQDASQGIIMVVTDAEGDEYGLLIDELVGKQQVVIKSLCNGLGELDGISGAAILGDGKVGLILDIKGVIQIAGNLDMRRSAPASQRGPAIEVSSP